MSTSEVRVVSDSDVPRREDIDRFMAKVCRGDSCWDWTGARNEHGYGNFRYPARRHLKRIESLAHRFAYRAFVGPIPRGMNVLHRCDNRQCVNPAHLWLGTHEDNMEDMARKGRAAKGLRSGWYTTGGASWRRARGRSNGNAKLSAETVLEVRARSLRGESVPSLSRQLGISETQLYRIVHGVHWKHVGALANGAEAVP